MIMMKNTLKSNLIMVMNYLIEIIIVARAIFLENSKFYPQVSLDECLYKISMKSKNEL